MTEISDEEFARRLQEEENAAAYDAQRARREAEDAALAQQLSREMPRHRSMGPGSFGSNINPGHSSGENRMGSRSRVGNNNNKFTIKSGQRVAVRLHHPLTKNHIGEVMYAHYITQTEVRFELCKSPGKSLRVNEHGGVEFSKCAENDLTSHFKFELTIQGPMYLLCKAYMQKINIKAETSWFLAMTDKGGLQGNSYRGQNAQWVLVAATDPNANSSQSLSSNLASSSSGSSNSRTTDGSLRRPDGFEPINDEDMEVNPLIPQENRSPRPEYSHERAAVADAARSLDSAASSSAVLPDSSTGGSSEERSLDGNYPSAAIPAPLDLHSVLLSPKDPAKEVESKVWRWISSGYGQSFLDSKCPAGKALYRDNPAFLRRLIHRPDWPVFASRAKDWKGRHRPIFNADLARSVLDKGKLRQFFEEGYTVLPGVCRERLTRRVQRVMTYWLSTRDSTWKRNNSRVELTGAVKTDPDLLALYYGSPLFHAAQLLVGEGDVADLDYGEISLIFPDMTLQDGAGEEDDSDSDDDEHGTGGAGADLINIKVATRRARGRDQMPAVATEMATPSDDGGGEKEESAPRGRHVGLSWVVDGFSKAGTHYSHSPNTLLMAVALTDMPAPDPMQGGLAMLNVHEGSHITLMEAMKDQVSRSSTLFSEALTDTITPGFPYSGVDSAPRGAENKPHLGAPTPVVLRAGDAFLCTTKLAITYGLLNPNSGQTANSLAFFRITHTDHEAGLKDISMENVWTEFRLAESILNPSSVEGDGGSASATPFGALAPAATSKITEDDHNELSSVFAAANVGATPTVATVASASPAAIAPPMAPPPSLIPAPAAAATATTTAYANLPPPPGENPYRAQGGSRGNPDPRDDLL